MAPRPQPGWSIYKERLDFLCHGDALWQPAPTDYTRITAGDVGFIRRGRFHLLFSAGSPLEKRRLGEDFPKTFEQLTVGTLVRDQPRLPGCLCTNTVRGVGVGLGATISTTLPLEPGANFSYELTGNSGAALVTKYPTYKEDSQLDFTFEEYTRRHYESWVAFARNKGYGSDVQPILVTGVDMTRDFAMVAYSYEDTSLESDLTITAPMIVSASASLWGTWRTRYSPHTNYGPQECAPPTLDVDISSLQLTEGGIIPSAFNQCVFVRYYTMRSRGPLRLFPKVIRAGAGPHDLGPGDNAGDTLPELVAQSDAELTDTDLEPDIVVRNTPYDREYDSWRPVANYIFQNSNATSVLVHNRDLAELRAGGVHDISLLLSKNRPQIVVDESGVGRIVCRQEPSQERKNPTVVHTIPLNPLQQLHDLDRASPTFRRQLSSFLHGKEYQDAVPNLQGEDLAWFVEYLGTVLASISNHASLAFQEYLRELGNICGVKEVLPKACTLSGSLLDVKFPFTSGDVYEGAFNGSKVWIQRVRIHPERDPQKIKTFYQVAVMRKYLAHSNIVPLVGVTVDPLRLALDWMPGGDLVDYIVGNPDADRLSLLSDIAEGLNYLHSCNVIHGDLKGSNVLVDTTGCARIMGFGLATVTQDLDSVWSTSDEHGDSARWIAPEILDGRGTYSEEADVFSFAMVMIETFTGAVPFSDKSPRAAMLAIVGGERPPRPTHPALTNALWALAQQCWEQEALRRPRVLQILRDLTPTWKYLIYRHLTTNERISLITNIFSGHRVDMVLRTEDAQLFVDVVDEALNGLTLQLRKKCLGVLSDMCGHHALLPRSLRIPLCYDRSKNALHSGGYADVWMGEHQGRKVAVKVLRVHSASDLDRTIIGRLCKEVVMWENLRHPNVFPLSGVTLGDNCFATVSEWMANGNIIQFVKEHRDANRFDLLGDVARGLRYIHDEKIIHGDLKGANILIDTNCHARLADFGLLTVVLDSTHHRTSSSPESAGTTRWMSPELLDPDRFGFKDKAPTQESDCYALGMVVLEVLTGQVPFPRHTGLVVMRKVIDGEHPERPQGAEAVWFTDDLWKILEQCWSSQPRVRPTVEAVLECLGQGSVAWQPLPRSADDSQTDTDPEPRPTVTRPLGRAILQDDDQSPTLSQSHPRSVDTHRSLFQPYPGSQQRLAKPPGLPESANVNKKLAHHPQVPAYMSMNSMNYYPTGTSNLGHYGTAHQYQGGHGPTYYRYAQGDMPTSYASGQSYSQPGINAQPTPGHHRLESDFHKSASWPQHRPNHSAPPEFSHGSTSTTQIQMPSDSQGQRGVMVPQRPYIPHHRQNYFDQFIPENPITFPSRSGRRGIALADVMNENFVHLIGGDDPMFVNYTGPAISLRLEWPGYKSWTRQIKTRDWRGEPKPITKAKLATEITKRIQNFIQDSVNGPITPGSERWKVGPDFIEAKDLMLVRLVHVSKGSWQAEFSFGDCTDLTNPTEGLSMTKQILAGDSGGGLDDDIAARITAPDMPTTQIASPTGPYLAWPYQQNAQQQVTSDVPPLNQTFLPPIQRSSPPSTLLLASLQPPKLNK